jgi:hypothetical protein
MAFRSLNRCVALNMAAFAHRVLLIGCVGIGFAVAGCGGSSETPQATSESSSEDASTDMAMNDEAMMGGSSEMEDPSMQGSMDSAMAQEPGEQFADAGLGDTSVGHGEEGGEFGSGGALGPGTDEAAMEAEMAAAETSANGEPGGDDANIEAQMAAAEAAANSADESGSDPAEMAAEMAAAASNGEFGPGSEGGEFGEGPGDPGGPNGGGGGAKAQEPPADSPDYPAFKVVMGLMEGKHDGLKEHVSTRGRGLIEKIRGGSLTKEEKDDLKKTFAQPQLVGTPRTIRGSRTVTLNSAGQVITLVSKKQGSAWKVSSISIRAAKKR